MTLRSLILATGVAAAGAGAARAQGVVGQIGHLYDDGGWTLYRIGVSRPLAGPVHMAFHGDYMTRSGDGAGAFAGAGIDVTAFRTGLQGPYAVAGIGGGLGSPHSKSFSSVWGSWSAGAGYDLLPARFLTFGVEVRWREISLDNRGGLELAAGLGLQLGGGRERSAEPVPASPASPVPLDRPAAERSHGSSAIADSVVETAAGMMGRRYVYGGTGEDGEGFDCSGLIQYAYAQHGVTLPRRSADQAREGREVARDPSALLPGDLLTFSTSGGPVTHVALYIGNGQFIHSATGGVQVSLLSPDDPNGGWWYQRWVGVRRILGA
jgi:cell wall-associated NlpC family hydrolase